MVNDNSKPGDCDMAIVPADRLLGMKFWASYTPHLRPAFKVYRYRGAAVVNGITRHYFATYKGPYALVSCTEDDLQNSIFYPFCIDYEQIMDAVKAKDEANATV